SATKQQPQVSPSQMKESKAKTVRQTLTTRFQFASFIPVNTEENKPKEATQATAAQPAQPNSNQPANQGPSPAPASASASAPAPASASTPTGTATPTPTAAANSPKANEGQGKSSEPATEQQTVKHSGA